VGIVGAMMRGRWIGRALRWRSYTVASVPTFWVGRLMVVVFAVWLGWFPVGLGVPVGVLSGDVTWLDRLQHLILPALTLSIVGVANITLHTRQKMIDVLSSDFLRSEERRVGKECR